MKQKKIRPGLVLSFGCLVLLLACRSEKSKWHFESEAGPLLLEVVADSIRVPFGMSFLPNGKMLVTNRFAGDILLLDTHTGKQQQLKSVPQSYSQLDGGALDILPHPDYSKNGWIYFSHSIGDSIKSTMSVVRGKLQGDSLTNIQHIFTALPYFKAPSHYGTRMAIKDGYLFFTMGDRYDLKDSAQTLGNHLGKVMRIFDDGSIPKDNPFYGREDAKPEIWSYGHRNPQGLIFHPETEELWLHEHGPKGGDELNLIHPGLNYGWPIICHGIDYDDTPIGDGITHKEGLEQPVHYYTPSIAPSGMEFYTGDKFPAWHGNLFIGAMAKTHLNRLVIKGNKVIQEERLLEEFGHRVRSVKQGPDGFLYIGIDGGRILRIRPD